MRALALSLRPACGQTSQALTRSQHAASRMPHNAGYRGLLSSMWSCCGCERCAAPGSSALSHRWPASGPGHASLALKMPFPATFATLQVMSEYYERCTDCDNPARQTEFGEWRDRILSLLASFQRCVGRANTILTLGCPHLLVEVRKRELTESLPSARNLALALRRPPFTLQRMCELLLNPERVYTSTRKLMSAIEKLLMVTTTLNVTTPARGQSTPAGANAGSGTAGGVSGASTSMLSVEAEGGTMPMDVDV